MNDHDGTNGTTTGPDGESGVIWVDVPTAARHFGISERAVRKRVSAGTVQAVRDGGRWLVAFPEDRPGTEERGPEAGRTRAGRGSVPGTSQTVLNRNQANAGEQAIANLYQQVADLTGRLVDLVDRAARAEAEAAATARRLDEVQADRDEMRDELRLLRRRELLQHIVTGAAVGAGVLAVGLVIAVLTLAR